MSLPFSLRKVGEGFKPSPTFILVVGLLLLMAPGGGVPSSLAQSAPPNRAGLIIVQPDQDPQTYCVALDEAGTSGLQLLERVGVDFIADYGNSMGAAICRIDGVGCNFPSQDCWCQCQGASCTYWSYHRLAPGETGWIYAQFGASQTDILPGSVEAWIWSPGDSASTQIQPPNLTFADICAGDVVNKTKAADDLNWPTYLAFAALLLALAGASILRRRSIAT